VKDTKRKANRAVWPQAGEMESVGLPKWRPNFLNFRLEFLWDSSVSFIKSKLFYRVDPCLHTNIVQGQNAWEKARKCP
jgi:hypothetical protein